MSKYKGVYLESKFGSNIPLNDWSSIKRFERFLSVDMLTEEGKKTFELFKTEKREDK